MYAERCLTQLWSLAPGLVPVLQSAWSPAVPVQQVVFVQRCPPQSVAVVSNCIKHREMTVQAALLIGVQVAQALAYLHAKKCQHRDVKSDNVAPADSLSQHSCLVRKSFR